MPQKKVNDLPIIFAFSNEQLDRALDDVCEYEDGKDVDEHMDAMWLSPVTKAAHHDARGDFLRRAGEKGWH